MSIIIFQNASERKKKVKTAALAKLCLANIRIVPPGKESEALISSNAMLMFPGQGSISMDSVSNKPDNLVLLDATWDKAHRMLSRSPFLQSLPRIFVPDSILQEPLFKVRQPPRHRIRCARSTAEIIAYAVEHFNGDHGMRGAEAIRRVIHEASEIQLEFVRRKDNVERRNFPEEGEL